MSCDDIEDYLEEGEAGQHALGVCFFPVIFARENTTVFIGKVSAIAYFIYMKIASVAL